MPGWLGPIGARLARGAETLLFGAPWLGADDPMANIGRMSPKDIAAVHRAIPPGVLGRHGTNPALPSKIPDLIGIKDRKYLDATGLIRHRNIGDLMRYATMNQDTDPFAKHLGKAPPTLCRSDLSHSQKIRRSTRTAAMATTNFTPWRSTLFVAATPKSEFLR